MEEQAATLQGKSLETPDETRRFVDKGKADIVHLGNVTVGRFVLEPGGRWSEHVKPIVVPTVARSAMSATFSRGG
jgi:quercetin dioxygenase-like cupin family protein